MASDPGRRPAAARLVRLTAEGWLLALVVLSPWALGADPPLFEFALYAGVAVFAALWALAVLLEGRFTWAHSPAAAALAGLLLLGAFQVTPLPRPVLGALSPATAGLYDEFLPGTPESLPGDGGPGSGHDHAGRTLSVNPHATRAVLVRLLAVLLVFAAASNLVASGASLRRLCLAAAVNGAALTVFAVVQFFSSPQGLLYWSFQTQVPAFGPMNRNHTAFYLNLCIGLAAGLLLWLWDAPGARRHGRALTPWQTVLLRPAVLWVLVLTAFMTGGVAFSLSRGGLVALLAGLAVTCLLGWKAGRRGLRGGLAVPLLLATLALPWLLWLGLGPVADRLSTLWGADALAEGRLEVWGRVLPLAGEFPVWGTGYGTFPYVEQPTRGPGDPARLFYDYAHNDYLEALIEGGVPRLLLTVLLVAFVFRAGYPALKSRDPRRRALALGCCWALTTAAVHSWVDFGVQVPANALLATVAAAQLCGLGAAARAEAAPARPRAAFTLGGAGAVAAALAVAVLGLVPARWGWAAHNARQFQLAARHAAVQRGPAASVPALEAAALWAPADPQARVELAEAHWAAYQAGRARLERESAVRLACALAGCPSPPDAAGAAAGEALRRGDEERLREQHLFPSLRGYVIARNLCPLLDAPNVRLAAAAEHLRGGDPPGAYLRRARRLLPSDADLWYAGGVRELADGDPGEAVACWRRCLEVSGEYLDRVLAAAPPAALSGPAERLLPDDPALLLRAAESLHPGDPGGQAPLLGRALDALDARPRPWDAEDYHLRARLCRALGDAGGALDAYDGAVARARDNAQWRYEYAELLREQGRTDEALEELRWAIRASPGHEPARRLREAILTDRPAAP